MRKYRLKPAPAYCYISKAADAMSQPLSYISRQMIAGVFDSQDRGDKDLTVCFTGHRIIPPQDRPALAERLDTLLNTLYDHGYRRFISGMAVGFDVLAAERVVALKERRPDVRLIIAIPCYEQWGHWTEQDCKRYEHIIYNTDQLKMLSPVYYDGCMMARNRYMVDNSAICLCYLTHSRGGTMSTVAYAMKNDCPVLNLAMPDACEAFIRQG